ncbi:MAG: alanine--tRNA ligase [Planctomycetota bacterium]|jgi:alanyl-tRNA synthetase
MTSSEIREAFLTFFEQRNHRRVPSAPVVPADDPTLLFTNAGMNQFKAAFLGVEKRDYVRATTSQKCIRAGGKHNDLEEVGKTPRHQTFFEMLGNFSFGDYFKREAIDYAWEFLTEVVQLPKERLWVTIFREDDEAEELWLEVTDIPKERIVRLGEKDNFWSMGDTGPCGPCTEIHFDRREPDQRASFDDEHCMEVWNLVFMQFDRQPDGTLAPLPKPSVDTGMGLERLTSILQGVPSNYDTDLLKGLVGAVAEIAGVPADPGPEGVPHRVIADHIRALSFAFADGALPSSDGRGYVLRRVLRRAARFGRKLGIEEAFLYRLVPTLVAGMGEAYPELKERQAHLELLIKDEEETFNRTLDRGLALFEEEATALPAGATFPGAVAWKLYDTYGFPDDLTRVLTDERGLTWDQAGYEAGRKEQQDRSRAAQQFKAVSLAHHGELATTTFTGYSKTEGPGAVVSFSEEHGELIIEPTPFYAESGGQLGDQGAIRGEGFCFEVTDTQKISGVFVHRGQLTEGSAAAVTPGAGVAAVVDAPRRARIEKNHTGTHLLHWALHEVVGHHATQAGSVVEPERLRFDFTHAKALTEGEVESIERMVNEKIRDNDTVQSYERSLEEAKHSGVTALFGEKYGDRVRVVDVAGYSRELCGGTHVDRTGEIGLFKIVQEQAVQAGVRRVVAVTGREAIDWALEAHRTLKGLSRLLSAPEAAIPERVAALKDQVKEWKRKAKEAARQAPSAAASSTDVAEEALGEVTFRFARLQAGVPDLRKLGDSVKKEKGACVGLFLGVQGGKAMAVAALSKSAQGMGLDASALLKAVTAACGGGGGGRPDMAQAGGLDSGKLDAAAGAAREAIAAAVGAS